ncbi:MAG: ImmA/IrrE family metallo-endopeptidase [Pyrinomonadaceae bacterium]
MQFLIEKISELNFGWNERPLSEADFYKLCKRFKVAVQEMPLAVGGFYYRVMDRDFIAVDSKLPPVKKLAVLYHELGHFLFHMPASGATANFHGVGRRTRQEIEADTFALCAHSPKMGSDAYRRGTDRPRRLPARHGRRASQDPRGSRHLICDMIRASLDPSHSYI